MARVSFRVAVATLSLSVAAIAGWNAHEGDGPVTLDTDGTELLHPYIPTQGDVPTIGHGSTRYEDGRRVTLADPPITRQRAESLARALHAQHEREFRDSLPGAALSQAEYDVYLDFVGQYGIGNWRQSSMRRHIRNGEYRRACDALLMYRFAAGYDCSTLIDGKPNRRCYGSWTRQQERRAKCIAEQNRIDWLSGTQLGHYEAE